MAYTPPPEPQYSWVQSAQQIQEGADAAYDAVQRREQISREIGHIAVQGTSQPR
jgi:hypothetical protein